MKYSVHIRDVLRAVETMHADDIKIVEYFLELRKEDLGKTRVTQPVKRQYKQTGRSHTDELTSALMANGYQPGTSLATQDIYELCRNSPAFAGLRGKRYRKTISNALMRGQKMGLLTKTGRQSYQLTVPGMEFPE